MVRKLSAVVVPLLLAGFVMALAPQAASAQAKKAATPSLKVCAATRGASYRFTVGSKTLKLTGGACGAVKVKAGTYKVAETWASKGFTSIKSIKVSPGKAALTTSTKTASVKLRVKTGTTTAVFTNAKVATGGGGYVEVCKWAYLFNRWTAGDFNFAVTSDGTTTDVTVAVGQCSAPIAVAGATATIVETLPDNFQLAAVDTIPSLDLASSDLATGTITVTIPTGLNVEADFWNEPVLAVAKACKTLASNAAALEGDTFVFDVSYSFTPPAPAATITGSGYIDVTAASTTGATVCEPFFPLLPVGTVVTISEDMAGSPANITSTLTGIIPPAANDGSTSTTAIMILGPGATDAMFTNGADGYIEVCKARIETYNYNNDVGSQPFQFSVNGGPDFTVWSGSCSAPMEVAAGTSTVTEVSSPDFFLVSVSTVAADDPMGLRLLSAPTANPASVSVPYGGVGDETVVTFTNHVDGLQKKICVQQTSPDANLGGATFLFTINILDATYYEELTISPSDANPTGLVCGALSPIIDAYWGSGLESPTTTITETQLTSVSGVNIAGVDYEGNGEGLLSPTSTPPWDLGTAFTFGLGAGENVITFTNGRTGV